VVDIIVAMKCLLVICAAALPLFVLSAQTKEGIATVESRWAKSQTAKHATPEDYAALYIQ
jgi:hypothetical protein